MKNSLFRYLCLAVALVSCNLAGAQQKANYQLAEKFRLLEQNPIDKYSTEVRPTFINDTDCFYYSFTTREGKKYYYVNPKKKEKRLLFDTDELLSKIAVYTKKAYSSADPHLSFTFMKDNETIRIDFDRGLYTYNIHTKELKQLDEKPTYKTGDPYWMKYSPDSLYFLYASKDNLYFVGNPKKGQDTIPVQLTTDGMPDYTFNREDEGKMEGRFGAESAHWIPGSHRFYAVREDNRKVRDLWVINSLSKPSPELITYKAELAGDKNVTQYELLLGDIDKREVKKVDINRWPDQYIDVLYASKDGKRLYFQRYNRTWNQSDICEVDVETGKVRVVIHEENKPYLDYQMRNVSFLNDGKEILFRSERNGWGHYYLYDTATGNLKNQLTDGTWVAGPVAQIDTVGRKMYFYGYGREKGIDPYYYILYEAHLDRPNALRLLTPENASHEVSISPSCRYLVDSYSTVSQEPVNVVRNRNGKVIMTLEKPDLQPVYEMGWKAPERFKVKAADGVTDLYGVMWKPFDFDSTKVYPVINYVYPGPQQEGTFFRYIPMNPRTDRLAQAGFVVVCMGHRGGHPSRSKWYHNYGYGNLRDYPMADHKVAIEQLCARYKFMDINRVGIHGHSGGGFMSTAAMLLYPDFFKVAVSCAGNHDNNIYNRWWGEKHHGVKEITDDMGNISFDIRIPTNQELARNLKGHLLLIHGDIDNNVHPANTIVVVDELIKAGKRFDMLIVPGKRHHFDDYNEYYYWRMVDYFSEYLRGERETGADIKDLKLGNWFQGYQ